MAAEEKGGVAVLEPAAVKAQFLHVKVVDKLRPDQGVINVKVPISLVKWGMKMAKAFSPEMKEVDVDWDEVAASISESGPQKIVEVEDEVQHRTVDVWVE